MKAFTIVILAGSLASTAYADNQLVCRGGAMTVSVSKDYIYGVFNDKAAVYTEIKFKKARVPGTQAMQLAPGECTTINRLIASDEESFFWYRRQGSLKKFVWTANTHALNSFNISIQPRIHVELMRDAGDPNKFLYLRTKSQGFRVVEAQVSERQTGRTIIPPTMLAPIENLRVRTRSTRQGPTRPTRPRRVVQ